MTRLPMDYSKTIVYKICCKDISITDCYVGHTTNFIKRKNAHKTNCNNPNDKEYNKYVYQFIRLNGGWDNWSIVEIEKYNCSDVNEALKRERFWFDQLQATLNKHIPARTVKEYCETNREKRLEYQKEYYQRNKEIIGVKRKEREQNNEAISNKKKAYREVNKEVINQRARERYQQKKNELTKFRLEQYVKQISSSSSSSSSLLV
jgi:hypothetical protein